MSLNGKINILGIEYTVREVECVCKEESLFGMTDPYRNTIRIDMNMAEDRKENVLCHEILHAIFDALGMDDLYQDEHKVQSLATAIHLVFGKPKIISS